MSRHAVYFETTKSKDKAFAWVSKVIDSTINCGGTTANRDPFFDGRGLLVGSIHPYSGQYGSLIVGPAAHGPGAGVLFYIEAGLLQARKAQKDLRAIVAELGIQPSGRPENWWATTQTEGSWTAFTKYL